MEPHILKQFRDEVINTEPDTPARTNLVQKYVRDERMRKWRNENEANSRKCWMCPKILTAFMHVSRHMRKICTGDPVLTEAADRVIEGNKLIMKFRQIETNKNKLSFT